MTISVHGHHRGARGASGGESTEVLLRVLSERSPGLLEDHRRVAQLARATASQLDLSEQDIERVELAARLHDIGKVAIPDAILNKPGPLNESEWEVMRSHTEIGERIIATAPCLADIAALVRSHHECYDGSGYPDGLAGEAIPFGACIIAVCDAFGAMMRQRPYSEAITVAEALAELRRCSGSQFHPVVVDVFDDLFE
jgi:two-component system cell cycle response regulator